MAVGLPFPRGGANFLSFLSRGDSTNGSYDQYQIFIDISRLSYDYESYLMMLK